MCHPVAGPYIYGFFGGRIIFQAIIEPSNPAWFVKFLRMTRIVLYEPLYVQGKGDRVGVSHFIPFPPTHPTPTSAKDLDGKRRRKLPRWT